MSILLLSVPNIFPASSLLQKKSVFSHGCDVKIALFLCGFLLPSLCASELCLGTSVHTFYQSNTQSCKFVFSPYRDPPFTHSLVFDCLYIFPFFSGSSYCLAIFFQMSLNSFLPLSRVRDLCYFPSF